MSWGYVFICTRKSWGVCLSASQVQHSGSILKGGNKHWWTSILVCANMAKGTLYELMISLQSLDLSSYPCITFSWYWFLRTSIFPLASKIGTEAIWTRIKEGLVNIPNLGVIRPLHSDCNTYLEGNRLQATDSQGSNHQMGDGRFHTQSHHLPPTSR